MNYPLLPTFNYGWDTLNNRSEDGFAFPQLLTIRRILFSAFPCVLHIRPPFPVSTIRV